MFHESDEDIPNSFKMMQSIVSRVQEWQHALKHKTLRKLGKQGSGEANI